jgi:hypothetical protein
LYPESEMCRFAAAAVQFCACALDANANMAESVEIRAAANVLNSFMVIP